MSACTDHECDSKYETMTKAFCDGFEINVGKIDNVVTSNDITALKNYLNMEIAELIIKNIHV